MKLLLRRRLRTLAVVAVALVAGSLLVVPRLSFAAVATVSIASKENGLCLTRVPPSSGDGWVLDLCIDQLPTWHRQLFTFDAPDAAGTAIRQYALTVCVKQDLLAGAPLTTLAVTECADNQPSGRWNLLFVGGGYRIQNAATGYFLDSSGNLARAQPSERNHISQLWEIRNRPPFGG